MLFTRWQRFTFYMHQIQLLDSNPMREREIEPETEQKTICSKAASIKDANNLIWWGFNAFRRTYWCNTMVLNRICVCILSS